MGQLGAGLGELRELRGVECAGPTSRMVVPQLRGPAQGRRTSLAAAAKAGGVPVPVPVPVSAAPMRRPGPADAEGGSPDVPGDQENDQGLLR